MSKLNGKLEFIELTLNIIKDNINEAKNDIKDIKEKYNVINIKINTIENKINEIDEKIFILQNKQKILNGYTKEKQKIIDTINYFIRSPKKIIITSILLSIVSISGYVSYIIINKLFEKLNVLQSILEYLINR